MKKETRKVIKHKTVPAVKDVEVYTTTDGKEFTNEAKAKAHQAKLDIPTKEFYAGESSGNFHFVSSMEDIKTLGFDGYVRTGQIKPEHFQFPGWYLFTESDSYGGWHITVSSLKVVKESLIEALKELPEEKNN